MEISIGSKITVVQPNTSEDPLLLLKKMEYYCPLIKRELVVASETYTSNGHSCFDVLGDSGTLNKGQKEGTRKTYFSDIGVLPDSERNHMECGGITKAFLIESESNRYMEELLNDKNIFNTVSNSLKLWGFNSKEEYVLEFIRMNDLIYKNYKILIP
jgi:hypothetical protein